MPLRNKRICFLLVLISIVVYSFIGYHCYAAFGKTSAAYYSGPLGMVTIPSGDTLSLGGGVFSGIGQFCIEVNSTQTPFRVYTDINGTEFGTSSYANKEQSCIEARNANLTIRVTNLSKETTLVTGFLTFDQSVVRAKQMMFAPLFTVIPLYHLLAIFVPARAASPRTSGRRVYRLAYYLGILPISATFSLLQLSVIAHSASGGQYIDPTQYFSLPSSYFDFFVSPSSLLFSLSFNSTFIWLVRLAEGGLLLSAVYLAWRGYRLISGKLTELLSRRDLVGIFGYYYITGGLFTITLSAISVYGAKEVAQLFSVPYSETFIPPVLNLFGLSQASILDALYLAELGVVMAILTRVWIKLVRDFPLESFSKALTVVSFASVAAILFSPQLSANYYYALAVFGFSAIPFLVLCFIVAMIHREMLRR